MKNGQERLEKAARPLFKAKAFQVRLSGLIQLSDVGLLLPPVSAETGHTPRLNAKRFEGLIVDRIRSNILTESNIRDLVRMLGEEMDGVALEQRQRLETIEGGAGRGGAVAGQALPGHRNHRPGHRRHRPRASRNTESVRGGLNLQRRRRGRCSQSAGRVWMTWKPLRPSPRT